MKKKYLKTVTSLLIGGVFLFLAFGSGSDTKAETKEYSKEFFCGKKFKSTHNISNIDMEVNRVTIFNTDGTYSSKEDWGTSSRNEDNYRNATGQSSGNLNEFSGTWQVLDNATLPSEIDDYLKNYEGHIGKFYNEKKFTVMKYNSNKGKSGYLLVSIIQSDVFLKPIVTPSTAVENGYDEAELQIFSGFLEK